MNNSSGTLDLDVKEEWVYGPQCLEVPMKERASVVRLEQYVVPLKGLYRPSVHTVCTSMCRYKHLYVSVIKRTK